MSTRTDVECELSSYQLSAVSFSYIIVFLFIVFLLIILYKCLSMVVGGAVGNQICIVQRELNALYVLISHINTVTLSLSLSQR